MLLKDKTVIVTGASQGIGEGIAIRMGEEGARVGVFYYTDADAENAEKVVERIKSAGGDGVAKQGDVTKYSDMEKSIGEVNKLWGSIDVLVNNAGAIAAPAPFITTKEEEWEMMINVDYKGVLICTHICAKYMIEQNQGRIINIASDTPRLGETALAVYTGAKGAVIGSTKSLAKELVGNNININCICPGIIDTPIIQFAMSTPEGKQMLEHTISTIPMKRLGLNTEIGDAAVFFASDLANYITGQILSVNGGLVMPS